jgi:hypothetical protein
MSGPALAAALRATAGRPDGLWLAARGRSMGRAVPTGAEVHVVASDLPPAVGEVWAFATAAGEVVVHRCVGVGPPHRFRGDARPVDDAPVAPQLLIGRVDSLRRDRGVGPVPPVAGRDRLRALGGMARRITRSGAARSRAEPGR